MKRVFFQNGLKNHLWIGDEEYVFDLGVERPPISGDGSLPFLVPLYFSKRCGTAILGMQYDAFAIGN